MVHESEALFDDSVLWYPKDVSASNYKMEEFRQRVNTKFSLELANYDQLWAWSVQNIAAFWGEVWDFTNIIHSSPYERVVDETKNPGDLPAWFAGARINYAENLLPFDDDHLAIIATGEGPGIRKVTYHELREQVRACSASLRAMGVTKGDRVVGYISNCVEAVVAFLATLSIGAIWSSTSPDFGVTGVLERFTQIKPKVIFSVNAVWYNGKVHDHTGKLKAVIHGLHDLEKVVIVDFVPTHHANYHGFHNHVMYDEFLSQGKSHDGTYPPLAFEQLPFDHPAYILFSSGTTGLPKCIVHGTGGPLIQHKKEHIIHGNLSRKDVVFQFTTTGWMMFNWLLSVLSVGATIVLFDGSPFKPDPMHLWKLVDEFGITAFGTSAKYLASLEEGGIKPAQHCKLTTLKSIYSTGSPLKPESFDYVYRDIKADVLLGSITGGTDIVSLFASHNASLPVVRGEIQCRSLGMAVECWDDSGKAVVGGKGDLVCTRPFPCQPVYFWNDADGQKYQKAYFSQFPGVWYHGDFLALNPKTRGIIMLGRSDGTLNPNGVRIGTAEIYNLVEQFSEVADCLVVGQQYKDDERVVLFLKMVEGKSLAPELIEKIKYDIRHQLSPRHVPSIVLPISDIPYTINGKKVEVAVKKIISGENVIPSGAIANPASLELFKNLKELQV